jgi:dolichyl-diphosphooligosaccharide--protein glycosyltransferase
LLEYHAVIVKLQGVMVRLMLVLAPVMCILAGIAISSTLHTYMKNLDVSQKQGGKLAKGGDRNYPYKNEV